MNKSSFAIPVFILLGIAFFSCRADSSPTGGDSSGLGPNYENPPPFLESITLGQAALTLDPGFSPDNFEYAVELPAENLEVRLNGYYNETNHPDFFVSYRPGQDFVPQDGSLAVISVSDGKQVTRYIISFSRSDLPKAVLEGVSLSAGTLNGTFSPGTFDYTATVPYGVNSVTVYANAPDSQPGSAFTFTPSVTVPIIRYGNNAGSGRVRIGVTAENHATGYYAVDFTESAALSSMLAGISLSAGAITDAQGAPVSFNPTGTSLQYITVHNTVTMLAVQAVRSVPGSEIVFSEGGDQSDGVTGVIQNETNLNDKTFSITVNNGIGYGDKTYNFKIRAVAQDASVLTELTAAGGTLAGRAADGDNDASITAFQEGHVMYNLNFANSTSSVTISAEAPGKTITINGDAVSSKTFNNPKASDPPVIITVSATGEIPTAYTVWFKRESAPLAELTGLSVSGGTAVRAFSGDDHGPYTFKVFASVPAALVRPVVPTGSGWTVSYSSPPNLSPPENKTIVLTVDGGPDWTATQYVVNIQVMNNIVPELSSLKINGTDVTLNEDVFFYSAEIPYGGTTSAVNVPIEWSVDQTEVSEVKYSFNNTGLWSDTDFDGFASGLTLEPNKSAYVIIKVRTIDNNVVNYFIALHREAIPNDLMDISYNYGNNDIVPTIDAGINDIYVPNFVTSLTITAAGKAAAAGSTVTYDPANSISAWSDNDSKTVTVTLVSVNKTWTLRFNKKSVAASRMASGGDVIDWIYNNDLDRWEEIHVFKSVGTQTLSFASVPSITGGSAFVAGGGGSGGGGTSSLAGGGGGGGAIAHSNAAIAFNAANYTIVVGAGGNSVSSMYNPGNQGGDSSFKVQSAGSALLSAIGGGRGAHHYPNSGGGDRSRNGGEFKWGGGSYANMNNGSNTPGAASGAPASNYSTLTGITEIPSYFCGGGAGAENGQNPPAAVSGGGALGASAPANSGGGGGGGRGTSGAGAAGIVVLRWPYAE